MDQSGGQLSEVLASMRDAVAGLRSEDLQGVDSGSLLADVAGARARARLFEASFTGPK